MIRIVLFALVLAAAIWAYHDWRKTSADKKRQKGIQYSLYALAITVVLLVITGRVNWILAPIAVALPYLRRLVMNPMMQNWLLSTFHKKYAGQKNDPGQSVQQDMDAAEARKILGFEPDEALTIDGIKKRHRALIQKVHPDRAQGSHFLASKINAARDVLIAMVNK